MTICRHGNRLLSPPRLRGIRYGSSSSEVHRRLLKPPFAPLCLAPPVTPESGVRVEIDWSEDGDRVENPSLLTLLVSALFELQRNDLHVAATRPLQRYSVTAQKMLCRKQIEFFYPKSVISRLINRDNRTQRTARMAHLGRSISARCCLLLGLFSVIISSNEAITILLRCRIERPISVARGKRCRSMAQGE